VEFIAEAVGRRFDDHLGVGIAGHRGHDGGHQLARIVAVEGEFGKMHPAQAEGSADGRRMGGVELDPTAVGVIQLVGAVRRPLRDANHPMEGFVVLVEDLVVTEDVGRRLVVLRQHQRVLAAAVRGIPPETRRDIGRDPDLARLEGDDPHGPLTFALPADQLRQAQLRRAHLHRHQLSGFIAQRQRLAAVGLVVLKSLVDPFQVFGRDASHSSG
jgi:hypothetical protein